MINTNILSFTARHQPRLPIWPSRSLAGVAEKLRRNLFDAGEYAGTYTYRFKPDLPGTFHRILIKSNGTWEHSVSRSDTVNQALKRWTDEHGADIVALMTRLQGQGLDFDIYGKIGTVGEDKMFCVYFVVVDKTIIYGEDALSTLLLKDSAALNAWYIIKESQEIAIRLESTEQDIKCPALTNLDAGTKVIGIPVDPESNDKTSLGLFDALACTYHKSPEKLFKTERKI